VSAIYPNRVRGRAVALATAANWGAAFLVSQSFLSLLDAMGSARTFWLFAFFGVVAFAWINRAVPETKGRALEDIERVWAEHGVARIAGPGSSRPPDG